MRHLAFTVKSVSFKSFDLQTPQGMRNCSTSVTAGAHYFHPERCLEVYLWSDYLTKQVCCYRTMYGHVLTFLSTVTYYTCHMGEDVFRATKWQTNVQALVFCSLTSLFKSVAIIIRANGRNSFHQFVFNSNEFLAQTIPAKAQTIPANYQN